MGAGLGGQRGDLALLVGTIDGTAQRRGLVALVEDVARLLIVAVEGGDLVAAAGERALQGAVEVVEVEVVVARALALQHEAGGIEADGLVGGLGKPRVALLAQGKAADGAAGVGHVEVHAALVAVEGDDGQLVLVAIGIGLPGEGDAGDIAVGIEGYVNLAGDAGLDVERVDGDDAVLHTRHRVFVGVGTGVEGILVVPRGCAGKEGEGVLGDVALDTLHVGQHAAVGAEGIVLRLAELFLVHPVGMAVDDFVTDTVSRHLHLGIVEHQLDEVEVVVADKGYHLAVGREGGYLLRTAFGEGRHAAVGHVVYIIGSGERAAIDGLRFRLDEDAVLGGAEDIAVEALERAAAACGRAEEGVHHLARAEGVAQDGVGLRVRLRIVFAIGKGGDTPQRTGTEGAVDKLVDTEVLGPYRDTAEREQ